MIVTVPFAARERRGVMARTDERDKRALPIVASIAVSTLILGTAQMIFVAFSPAIIAATPAIPPQLVVPWVRWAIAEHDGIETYVALTGMLFFLVTTVALTFALRKVSQSTTFVLASIGAAAAAVIILRTRSSEFFPLSEISLLVLFCIATSSLLGVWYVVYTRASTGLRRIGLIAGFICFAAAVVLIAAATVVA